LVGVGQNTIQALNGRLVLGQLEVNKSCVVLELGVELARGLTIQLTLGLLEAQQAGFKLLILIQDAPLVDIDEVLSFGVKVPVL
jgi:hypothetical protein